MKDKLMLFVWKHFADDYYGGLAFAIARNKTEAKKLIRESRPKGLKFSKWGKLTIKPLTHLTAESVSCFSRITTEEDSRRSVARYLGIKYTKKKEVK